MLSQFITNLIEIFFIKKPKFRRAVTSLLEGNKDITISILGSDICINTVKEHGLLRAHRKIGRSTLLRDELPIIINLSGLIKDGDHFIDVGANVGIYSLIMGKFRNIFPNFHVTAFEANPDTFLRLEHSCKKHSISCHNVALSDKEGQLDFYEGAVSHVFTTVENASGYSIKDKIITVKAQRLDSFHFDSNSLVIKIDVEGQEFNVVKGFSKFLENNRVRLIYIDGYSDEALLDYLKNFGFTFYDCRTLKPTDGKVFNLLAVKKS